MKLFNNQKIIPALSDPADWLAWRESLRQWRDSARSRFNHDPSLYNCPEFEWLESCFAISLAMLCDQTLFDPQCHQFTPETLAKLVQDIEADGYHALR